MLDFIITSLIWILAIYGLFEIIKTIINLFTFTNLKSDGIYMIVATKNQEQHIEMFIRSLIFRLIYGKEDFIKNIIMVDLDSVDDTKKILSNLEKDYDCLKLLNLKDCEELIHNINTN